VYTLEGYDEKKFPTCTNPTKKKKKPHQLSLQVWQLIVLINNNIKLGNRQTKEMENVIIGFIFEIEKRDRSVDDLFFRTIIVIISIIGIIQQQLIDGIWIIDTTFCIRIFIFQQFIDTTARTREDEKTEAMLWFEIDQNNVCSERILYLAPSILDDGRRCLEADSADAFNASPMKPELITIIKQKQRHSENTNELLRVDKPMSMISPVVSLNFLLSAYNFKRDLAI
jgi:hypothetical protein